MLQMKAGALRGGVTCSIHSNEEAGGQRLGGLAHFAVLLCASLVAEALSRDRNGQAMARTKQRSQLAPGLERQHSAQWAGGRSEKPVLLTKQLQAARGHPRLHRVTCPHLSRAGGRGTQRP